MFDCPISGGPAKAAKGTLTSMVGGPETEFKNIKNIIDSFSNSYYIGELGSAHSVKSINNLLNVSNLILSHRGISSLKKYGIDQKLASEIISNSSGRSLMTEERIPNEVLNNNFDYGFKIGLMKKDVDIALDLIEDKDLFKEIVKQIDKTIDKYGDQVDYTFVCKE